MDTKKLTTKDLCLELMRADSEAEVIKLLTQAGYWDDARAWRPYGGRASNFNTIGNQQSRPDAAIVEKLVNSIDARLINECLEHGINPESPAAPKSMRRAVALFFEDGNTSSTAGLVREWPNSKRTEVSKGITLAATGFRPNQGNPCFMIADCGEGQSPDAFPNTLLSLDRDNKVKIPFVQGKFNMGGTGVLEFCGKRNLQLVLSRRNPRLLPAPVSGRNAEWGFTVVRREDPEGGRKSSVYTYLAPVSPSERPDGSAVLAFSAESMPIFPEGQKALGREAVWGTLIKVYEYSVTGFSRSNILMRDGLLRQLDILLTGLALPIRLYECRPFGGHAGSFETTLTGIGVRLEDDKGSNLEGDPESFSMQVQGESMTGTIYVFKKGKADTYKSDEGVLFAVNGQTQGHLSEDFFRRKKVGMSYLADSLLIAMDCSEFSARARELLFMPDRETLRDCELKRAIENELEELVNKHEGLRALRERRRREEIESMLADAKPLEDLLEDLIKDSPTLAQLFLKGTRISNPFKINSVGDESPAEFSGKRFPTYFKFHGQDYGTVLTRNCNENMRARISFETDAENSYFSREIQAGTFQLYSASGRQHAHMDYVLNLQNGIASLSVPLPEGSRAGDTLDLTAEVTDESRLEPFTNKIRLNIIRPRKPGESVKTKRRRPPSNAPGQSRERPAGVALPTIVKVAAIPAEHQKSWTDMKPPFHEHSALRIIHAGTSLNGEIKDVYDFYVNVDNIYLKTEEKASKEDPKLIQAKFTYGLVLLGLALINEANQREAQDVPESKLEQSVEQFTQAVARVLVPMINELGALELGEE